MAGRLKGKALKRYGLVEMMGEERLLKQEGQTVRVFRLERRMNKEVRKMMAREMKEKP